MVQAPSLRTKVVVRKLPPGLTEEGFKAAADKVAAGTYTWLAYHQGKVSTRKLTLSRAYLDFSDPRHVVAFKAAFDGHAFVTTKGNQYRCAVEYAPYQKVPKPATKKNPLEGTIEQDPHYQAFLKELQEGPALLPSAAAQREQLDKEAANGTGTASTPNALIEYLKEKHASGGAGGGRKGQRDTAQAAARAALQPGSGDKKGVEGRPGSAKAVDARSGTGTGAAHKAADSAQHKADAHKAGKDKSGGHGRARDGSTAPKTSAGAAAAKGTAPAGASSAASQKTLLARPKDAPAATEAGRATSCRPTSGDSRGVTGGRGGAAGAAGPVDRNRPAAGAAASAAAAAAARLPSRAAGGPLAGSRPAGPAAAAAASSQAAPSRPAAAVAGAAAEGSSATGDEASGATAAAAAPARRVRAGFQAYRPPVRPGRQDDDSG